jgi:BTB/POZ domain-containing protein KCTD9
MNKNKITPNVAEKLWTIGNETRFFLANLGVRTLGVAFVVLAFFIGVFGHLAKYKEFLLSSFLDDFYANISSEFASIGITVLLVDSLIQLRDSEKEKRRLLRFMKSRTNSVAVGSANFLRLQGWLFDGSLCGLNLDNSDLSGGLLYDASLPQISFNYSKLRQVDLTRANLESASGIGSDLSEAKLFNAILKNSILTEANLTKSSLNSADFTNSKCGSVLFMEAKLYNAIFHKANLKGADFESIKANNADFQDSDCSFANFNSASLPDVKMRNTILRNATFRNALLNSVVFENSDLTNVDFRGAEYLSLTNLSKAKRLRGMIMPDGVKYDGSFNLLGDLDDAKEQGFDVADLEQMRSFYGV